MPRLAQRFDLIWPTCHSGNLNAMRTYGAFPAMRVVRLAGSPLFHAKDEAARPWHLSWAFEPTPSDPYHLFPLMKDLQAMVGR